MFKVNWAVLCGWWIDLLQIRSNRNCAHFTARHPCASVAHEHFASMSDLDQFAAGFGAFWVGFKVKQNQLAFTGISSDGILVFAPETESFDEDIRCSCTVNSASLPILLKLLNDWGWLSWGFFFNGSAIQAAFGINRQGPLQEARKDWNSLQLNGFFKFGAALEACTGISRIPGRIT